MPCASDHEMPTNLCALLIHENKAPGLNIASKQKKSTEPKLPIVVQSQPRCVNSRLVMLSLLLGREKDEGCDSHLLIVTGRGWTPARKRAIVSLRCSYCQNFNTATKSILQGQIQKSLSKLQHTEECVLGYRLFYYKDCSDNFNWNPAGFDKLF